MHNFLSLFSNIKWGSACVPVLLFSWWDSWSLGEVAEVGQALDSIWNKFIQMQKHFSSIDTYISQLGSILMPWKWPYIKASIYLLCWIERTFTTPSIELSNSRLWLKAAYFKVKIYDSKPWPFLALLPFSVFTYHRHSILSTFKLEMSQLYPIKCWGQVIIPWQ